ncbi:MAG: hypothetical protein KA385_13540 [Vicinamibacteria bacterium]|nr:hypothetical protein [Vicinamibacteria bacterium]
MNSIAGGVANFVAQDREGIKSAMIANLISGKPITDGLEDYDIERYLGRTPLPAKRVTRQREEELDEADDDEDDDLEEERPRRKAQKSKPDPQLVGALQGVAKALQTIQARQDALEKIENDRRAAEQTRVQREQQQAFRDKVEAAILRTPSLAELPRKDAMEMMVAKMQSSGSRDPMLVANYWAKTLGKRDQKVANSAIREQNKVVKKNAAIPAGGTPPTGRVAAAAKAKAAPQTEEELVIQLMGELEALGEGR